MASLPVERSKVLIIGSGPAGLTAAIYAARAELQPICVEGAQAGGQLTITTEVENYPGFPKGVQGPELMVLFREQAARFGTRLVQDDVEKIDFSSRPFKAWTSTHELQGDAVVIACGARAKLLGLPTESELMGYGVSACATCDGFFAKGQEIAVVGGGDTAMEEATFLTKFASKVTIVHRREEFRASRIMLSRAQENPKIAWALNKTVERVIGNKGHDGGGVTGIELRDKVSGELATLPVQMVFIAIGHEPNTSLFRDVLELDEHGYVKTQPGSTRTSIPGVFAAGDIADRVYRQAITAAGTGCMAAIDAERWLSHQ